MTTYQYTSAWDFKEHMRALRAVSAVTLRRRPWVRAFRLGFPALLVALAFGPRWLAGQFALDLPTLMAALPWLLIAVFWIILLRWGEPYIGARRTRRIDPSANGSLTRTLSLDGFRIDGTGQGADFRWDTVHSVVETPEFFLIFFNRLSAYYVPKRLIVAPEELHGLRQLISEKLTNRAQLQRSGSGRAA